MKCLPSHNSNDEYRGYASISILWKQKKNNYETSLVTMGAKIKEAGVGVNYKRKKWEEFSY